MGHYYFLTATLPTLKLEESPHISFPEIKWLLEMNLSKEDLKQVEILRRYYDFENLRAISREEEGLDPRGNLSHRELEEAILHRQGIPAYAEDFLCQHETFEARQRAYPELLSAYFRQEAVKKGSFLERYMKFEYETRLVMMGLRAHSLGRNLSEELKQEDASDPLIASLLSARETHQYEPPAEYAELTDIWEQAQKQPWQGFRALAKWRFEQIEELVQKPIFAIDWILGYVARLFILEDIYSLDKEQGMQELETVSAR